MHQVIGAVQTVNQSLAVPARIVKEVAERLVAFRKEPDGSQRRAITDDEVVALGALFFLGIGESERYCTNHNAVMEKAADLADRLRDGIETLTQETW